MDVNILESMIPLTTREKIKISMLQGIKAIKDLAKEDKEFTLKVDNWAKVHVYNEKIKEENKEYDALIIMSEGELFTTSSEYAIENFIKISEMIKEDEQIEEYSVKFILEPSKNRKEQFYLSCSLV